MNSAPHGKAHSSVEISSSRRSPRCIRQRVVFPRRSGRGPFFRACVRATEASERGRRQGRRVLDLLGGARAQCSERFWAHFSGTSPM